ncbi:MAG: hypothetical protein IB618_01755 [Candidatus Pacearchaeota archaeon]|nr:MAG: hypothetical protein IB618_01755 [Candidatus Pacearchaeota archaeon]
MDIKEQVKTYVGGQIEIQNSFEEYIYRGEIERISIEKGSCGDELHVGLAWLAKGKGFPPQGWVKDDKQDYYRASLLIYSIFPISDGRICCNSSINHETVVLFPKNGSKLDPSKVEGLEAKFEETGTK